VRDETARKCEPLSVLLVILDGDPDSEISRDFRRGQKRETVLLCRQQEQSTMSVAGLRLLFLIAFTSCVSWRSNAQVAPGNDECENAISLQPSSEVVLGSTINATEDGLNICGSNFVISPGVWYFYQISNGATSNKVVHVSTCTAKTNFDTAITVFSGSCSDLKCVGGLDDDLECDAGTEEHSTIGWQATPEVGYYILVHGSLPEHNGDFGLIATETESLDNTDDDPSHACTASSLLWLVAMVLPLLAM
jgi:hypothetical protein